MYILTGGAGFIGSAFLAWLNNHGIEDVLVVDELSTGSSWKNLIGKRFTDYVHKDEFLNLIKAGNFRNKIKAVIHLGACSATTEKDVDYLMRNNFHYSCHMAELALARGARFLYASSAATYGDGSLGYDDKDELTPQLRPLNPYGFSKVLFDSWVLKQKLSDRVCGLRYFNVFGPNEYHKGDMRSVVHKSWEQIKANGSVALFKSHRPDYKDGEQKRDFIYVKDCAEVMGYLLTNHKINGIFNLGTGTARSWNDLVSAVFKALGKPTKIEFIEMPGHLKNQYQYFTEAKMQKLSKAGCSLPSTVLEAAVTDYVTNYLEKDNQYL